MASLEQARNSYSRTQRGVDHVLERVENGIEEYPITPEHSRHVRTQRPGEQEREAVGQCDFHRVSPIPRGEMLS